MSPAVTPLTSRERVARLFAGERPDRVAVLPLRIPANSAAKSGPNRPPSPVEFGHRSRRRRIDGFGVVLECSVFAGPVLPPTPLLLPHGLTRQGELVRPVHEPIEDGVGQDGIGDGPVLLPERQLGADHGGAPFVTVVDDLKKFARLTCRKRREFVRVHTCGVRVSEWLPLPMR